MGIDVQHRLEGDQKCGLYFLRWKGLMMRGGLKVRVAIERV